MTPEQLQAHAAALGYPWVAMQHGRVWRMFTRKPTWMHLCGGYWTSVEGHEAVVEAAVAYDGTAQKSLRGPKEAKR